MLIAIAADERESERARAGAAMALLPFVDNDNGQVLGTIEKRMKGGSAKSRRELIDFFCIQPTLPSAMLVPALVDTVINDLDDEVSYRASLVLQRFGSDLGPSRTVLREALKGKRNHAFIALVLASCLPGDQSVADDLIACLRTQESLKARHRGLLIRSLGNFGEKAKGAVPLLVGAARCRRTVGA